VLQELASALGLKSVEYAGVAAIQRDMAITAPDPSPTPMPVLVGPAHP
jgi:hypothetical protein